MIRSQTPFRQVSEIGAQAPLEYQVLMCGVHEGLKAEDNENNFYRV